MLFMQRVRMNWGSLISNLLKHTYTDTHTTMDKEQKGCGCRSDLNTITSGLTIAVIYLFFYISSLSFSLSLSSFFTLLISLWSNISQRHFHFVKTPFFFCYLSYFCYKTCTGCLEQQQKYNIQFICNLFCLIIINSLAESSWSFSSIWLFQVHCPKWSIVHLGVGRGVRGGGRGTNKYIGQDVKKLKQEF